MKRIFIITQLFILFSIVSNAQLKYPVARTQTFDTLIYDQHISDEYFWMSRKEHENEMIEFSRQQGKLRKAATIQATMIYYTLTNSHFGKRVILIFY